MNKCQKVIFFSFVSGCLLKGTKDFVQHQTAAQVTFPGAQTVLVSSLVKFSCWGQQGRPQTFGETQQVCKNCSKTHQIYKKKKKKETY